MQGVLEQIRRRIGPVPRRIPLEMRRLLIARPPHHVRIAKDELMQYYRNQELLLREGQVGWGAVVQANFELFGPGPSDLPSTMIFSTEPAIEAEPQRLVDIAHCLYGLKGGKWDHPEEQRYGDMLADEKERAMGITIPMTQAQGLHIRSTTVMLHRRNLPSRVLVGNLLPILTHASTGAIMVVPSRSWPEDFAAGWRVETAPFDDPIWINNLVRLTEWAATGIRDLYGRFGDPDSWYVRFYVDEPTDGFHDRSMELQLEFSLDPAAHSLSETCGIRVLVARSQADLFFGHHVAERPPRPTDGE